MQCSLNLRIKDNNKSDACTVCVASSMVYGHPPTGRQHAQRVCLLLIRKLRCGRPSHSSTRAIFNFKMVLRRGWRITVALPRASLACSIGFKGICWPKHSLNILAFQIHINHESPMCSRIVIHKNEFRANSTLEKMHIGL